MHPLSLGRVSLEQRSPTEADALHGLPRVRVALRCAVERRQKDVSPSQPPLSCPYAHHLLRNSACLPQCVSGAGAVSTLGIRGDPNCNHPEASRKEQKPPRSLRDLLAIKKKPLEDGWCLSFYWLFGGWIAATMQTQFYYFRPFRRFWRTVVVLSPAILAISERWNFYYFRSFWPFSDGTPTKALSVCPVRQQDWLGIHTIFGP